MAYTDKVVSHPISGAPVSMNEQDKNGGSVGNYEIVTESLDDMFSGDDQKPSAA